MILRTNGSNYKGLDRPIESDDDYSESDDDSREQSGTVYDIMTISSQIHGLFYEFFENLLSCFEFGEKFLDKFFNSNNFINTIRILPAENKTVIHITKI